MNGLLLVLLPLVTVVSAVAGVYLTARNPGDWLGLGNVTRVGKSRPLATEFARICSLSIERSEGSQKALLLRYHQELSVSKLLEQGNVLGLYELEEYPKVLPDVQRRLAMRIPDLEPGDRLRDRLLGLLGAGPRVRAGTDSTGIGTD